MTLATTSLPGRQTAGAQLFAATEPRVFRDKDGRILNLSATRRKRIERAWGEFERARTAFCYLTDGRATRSLYNAHIEAACRLVEFQAREGVWLIHPANAGPGLRPLDPRIAEDGSPALEYAYDRRTGSVACRSAAH